MTDQTQPPAEPPAAAVTAADIRAAARKEAPRERGVLTVPEWGNARVYVRVMTGDERAAVDIETARRRKKDRTRVRVRERIVIATAEDEAGVRLFAAADEDWLAAKDVSAVDRVFKMGARLNGYVDDEDDAGN